MPPRRRLYLECAVSTRRRLQVRINECVYVKRMTNDEHKRKLAKLNDPKTANSATPSNDMLSALDGDAELVSASVATQPGRYKRSDLRIMRVHRLFMAAE